MGQNQTENLPMAQELRNAYGDVNSYHTRQTPYWKPGWYMNYFATSLIGEQQYLTSLEREKGVVMVLNPQIRLQNQTQLIGNKVGKNPVSTAFPQTL